MSDLGHGALDVLGLVPGAGEFADAANAAWYAAEGDYLNAGISAAAMVPFAGWAATGFRGLRHLDEALDAFSSAERLFNAPRTPDFEVNSNGVVIPTNRQRLKEGLAAVYLSTPTDKPGTKYMLPGVNLRVMEPTNYAELRLSANSPVDDATPVSPFTNKPVHAPPPPADVPPEKVAAWQKQYRRERLHVGLYE